MRQLQTIYDNVILVSENLQTDIEIGNEAITEISDNVILVSESLQTDIKIENEAIMDHLW